MENKLTIEELEAKYKALGEELEARKKAEAEERNAKLRQAGNGKVRHSGNCADGERF